MASPPGEVDLYIFIKNSFNLNMIFILLCYGLWRYKTCIGGKPVEILYALLELWTESYENTESNPEPELIIDEPMRFEYLM
jgi:hypothetical protein